MTMLPPNPSLNPDAHPQAFAHQCAPVSWLRLASREPTDS